MMNFRKVWPVAVAGCVILVLEVGCNGAFGPSAAPAAASQESAGSVTGPAILTPNPGGQVNTGAAAALATAEITLDNVAEGLVEPTYMAEPPDGSGRFFVAERLGTIHIVKDGTVLPQPFLDLSSEVKSKEIEQGLLGLAFSPDYAHNGFFFVSYTDQKDNVIISRFSVSSDPDVADATSETEVLKFKKSAAQHNGGDLEFGPDGYLYISIGEGGIRSIGGFSTGPQRGESIAGKILRIDVKALPYSIPQDNPFVDNPAALPEIWDVGLRNPWRFSFDLKTGDIYISDVGEGAYEEVNFEPAGSGGKNYGWPILEGNHCALDFMSCDGITDATMPIIEYTHDRACAVIGGYIYRGSDYPGLSGIYFFGDHCTGKIWGAAPGADGTWEIKQFLNAPFRIHSFGEDRHGELYVLDGQFGVLYRINGG
jgi:glucose/arabinose dehydrogenase